MTRAVKGNSTEAAATRRTKRRADDTDKASPPSLKRRSRPQSNPPSNQARKTPRLSSGSNGSKRPANSSQAKTSKVPAKKKPSTPKKQLSAKQKEEIASLLEQAELDQDSLSVIKARLDPNRNDSKDSDEDQGDFATVSPSSTKRRVQNSITKVRTRSSSDGIPSAPQPSDELSDDDKDNGIPEYKDEEAEDDDDDDDILDVEQHEQEKRDGAQARARLGGSDDEQELSLQDDRSINADVPSLQREMEPVDNEREDVRGTVGIGEEESTVVKDSTTERRDGVLAANSAIDETVVVHVINSLKKSLMTDLQSSFHQVLGEIRTDRDSINKLRDHVSELTSIVTTTATAIFIKHTASQPRGKAIQRKLCLLPAFFNDHFMLMVTPRVVAGFFVNNLASGSTYSAIEDKGVEYISLMYFSMQPNDTQKEKFGSHVGKVYSKFRYSLLTTSVLAMQENSFDTFQRDLTQSDVTGPSPAVDAQESSTVAPSMSTMRQPFYLKAGYITGDHCVLATDKKENRGFSETEDDEHSSGDFPPQARADNESTDMIESSQSSGKAKVSRSGPITRDEIATEAASMVYRIGTSFLYRARQSSKLQLFHDVTYLFTGWGQHDVTIDQRSLSLNWEKEKTTEIAYVDDLPRTKLVRPTERRSGDGEDLDKIDTDNIVHFETLISQHPELSLIIEHNVMVEQRTCLLRYRINLIEVACRLLASYVTLDSVAKGKEVLSTDKRCFKAIVALAIGLRRLMEGAVHDLNTKNDVLWANNFAKKGTRGGKRGRPRRSRSRSSSQATSRPSGPFTEYKFEEVNGMSLEQLMPAPSKQKQLLNQMILNLTVEEFNARSINNNNGSTSLSNLQMGHTLLSNRGNRIQADESQSVFRF